MQSEQSQIIKASKISDIVINEIIFGTKKSNKVPIIYKSSNFIFQTPFLELSSHLIDTPFPDLFQMITLFNGESKKKIDQWFQFIENVETRISEQIENNNDWFSNTNVSFKSLIRGDKDNLFVKWIVDLKENIFIDESRNEVNPFSLKAGDLVKLIVEIPYLWIKDDQFGIVVTVHKGLVKSSTEKEEVPTDYQFDDDTESESSEDDDMVSLLATEQKENKTKLSNSKQLPNSKQAPNLKQTPNKFVPPSIKTPQHLVRDNRIVQGSVGQGSVGQGKEPKNYTNKEIPKNPIQTGNKPKMPVSFNLPPQKNINTSAIRINQSQLRQDPLSEQHGPKVDKSLPNKNEVDDNYDDFTKDIELSPNTNDDNFDSFL